MKNYSIMKTAIRATVFIAIYLLFALTTAASGVAGHELTGHWLGSLMAGPGVQLRLTLEITRTAAGKMEGVLTSVDQGNARIPLSALSVKDGVVHLEATSIGAMFDGKLDPAGSEIGGDWKQGGASLPLVFKRQTQPANFSVNRPQEPKKPYPYTDEEVVVENKTAGLKLAGTLTLPPGPGPHPAAVLITGSGPQDRDETVFNHRPFLVLADYLTRQGIAVLRCDDRGVGKSTGDFAKATDADFVEDALAEVAYLGTRKEIDPGRVGLVGHSEGGTVAARAAIRSSDVAYIVLLAGVGLPLEEVLLRQGRDLGRAAGSSEKELATEAAIQRDIFRIVKTEADPAAAKTALRNSIHQKIAALTNKERAVTGVSEAMIEGQIEAVLSPWFREMLTYDPRPTLKAVRCPVLALNGEKDLQVNAEVNLAAVRDALRAGGNQNVRIVQLPGLNHLFQKCMTGSLAEYAQIEQTFDPHAMQLVSGWICAADAQNDLAASAPELLEESSR